MGFSRQEYWVGYHFLLQGFIAIAIFLFAFSSIIGNYYYGEANIRFITSNTKVLTIYRLLSGGVMVMFGALASFELVWNIVDRSEERRVGKEC